MLKWTESELVVFGSFEDYGAGGLTQQNMPRSLQHATLGSCVLSADTARQRAHPSTTSYSVGVKAEMLLQGVEVHSVRLGTELGRTQVVLDLHDGFVGLDE